MLDLPLEIRIGTAGAGGAGARSITSAGEAVALTVPHFIVHLSAKKNERARLLTTAAAADTNNNKNYDVDNTDKNKSTNTNKSLYKGRVCGCVRPLQGGACVAVTRRRQDVLCIILYEYECEY
jgi:hypothetical protein